jgi:hypothetical protein
MREKKTFQTSPLLRNVNSIMVRNKITDLATLAIEAGQKRMSGLTGCRVCIASDLCFLSHAV